MVLASVTLGGGAAAPKVTEQSDLTWTDPAPWFGGLSGVEISADGRTLTAISDRGRLIVADMIRESGKLVGVRINHSVAMRNADGQIMVKPFTDAEGLALDDQGNAYVSFEGQHRVTTLNRATGQTKPLAPLTPIDFAKENAGLEALAIRADGVIFALPEASVDGQLPLMMLSGDQWSIAARLPVRGPFLPVGADFDHQGRLYLLERTITPLGFRSQIRRFTFDSSATRAEVLLETAPARYDNLEGISVWRDAKGRIMLTLVSDDNFFPFQTNQIIEFLAPD